MRFSRIAGLVLGLTLATLLTSAPLAAGESKETSPALKVPQKRLEFPRTTLWHFLDSMTATTGVPFQVDPVVRDKKISYIEDNVSWNRALDHICSSYQLRRHYDGRAVWVYPEIGATAAFVERALQSGAAASPAAPPMTTVCFQVPVVPAPAPSPAPVAVPEPPPAPAWDTHALSRVGFIAGSTRDVPNDDLLRESLNDWSGNGMLVLEIVPETPAQESGLRRGDVIVRFADRTVETPSDILAVTKMMKSPGFVGIEYLRAGEMRYSRILYTPHSGKIGAHDNPKTAADPKGRYTAKRIAHDKGDRKVGETDPKLLMWQGEPKKAGAPKEKKESTDKPAEAPPAQTQKN